mgnify:FL=1
MVTTSLPSSPRDGLELECGAATDVGKVRRLNEDSYLVTSGACVVADGMGGHQAGDVASRLTIEAVEGLLAEGLPDVSSIGSVVTRANSSVRSHAGSVDREGMGSTLVGAFVVRNADEDSIVVVNVGDSRCYAVVDDVVLQITKDHSHVQELVDAGSISQDAAATHPERNVVTRAIGIEDDVAGDFFVLPSVERMRLLLCSDGVSGELTFDEIASILTSLDDPAEAATALISSVLEGRAADNATAIVVDVRRTLTDAAGSTEAIDVTGPRPAVVAMADPDDTARYPSPAPVLADLIFEVPATEPDADQTQAEAATNSIIDDVPH